MAVTRVTGGVDLIWPANAIVAGLLIRLPSVRWLSAGIALFVAGVAANILGTHDSWGYAAALTAVNLIEIGAMVWTYRFAIQFPYPNITVYHSAHMTLVFGVAIPGLAAVVGGPIVHALTSVPATQAISQWWGSDAVGACLFGPPIILFHAKSMRRLVQGRFLAQNTAILLICIVTCYLAIRYVRFPFAVLGAPLLIAAFRVGGFGTSVLGLCSGLTVIGLWLCGVRPTGLEDAQQISSLSALPIIALLAAVMPPTAVGLGTDARREATRALRFSERRFRESMERSPIGMLMMDLGGVWTFTNTALQRMLGYSHEELRAFPPGGPTDPKDMQNIDTCWQQLKSGEIESYEMDRRFMHKDGRWIWVHAAVSLVRDEDGSPLHFIAQIESLEARRRAEENLAEERERLKVTLLAIDDAVMTTDASTRITYINPAAQRLLDQKLSLIENRRLDEVISLTDPETSKPVANLVGQCIVHGTVFRRINPSVLHRPDGTLCYVTDVVSPVVDSTGHVTSIVIVLRDASAEFERARDLRHRATHDAITGLANRFEFQRHLKEVFVRSNHMEVPAAVLAIDLDRFKTVNDTGGHAAGDAVLGRVAQVLRMAVRHSDMIARLGGDEFAIILQNCPQARSINVAERILRALNPLETEWEGATFNIGASVGLAMITPHFDTETEWLAKADQACYEAKRAGRGRMRISEAAT